MSERKPQYCKAESPGELPYLCTRPLYHSGPHVAHGSDNRPLRCWPPSTPPSSQPASEPPDDHADFEELRELSAEVYRDFAESRGLPVPALPDSDTRLKELIADVRDALRVTDDAQGLSSLAAIESFFAQQEARIRSENYATEVGLRHRISMLETTLDSLRKQGAGQ